MSSIPRKIYKKCKFFYGGSSDFVYIWYTYNLWSHLNISVFIFLNFEKFANLFAILIFRKDKKIAKVSNFKHQYLKKLLTDFNIEGII